MFGAALAGLARLGVRAFGDGEVIAFQRGAETWTLARLKTGDVAAPADRGLLSTGYAFLVLPEAGKPEPARGDLLPAHGVAITSVETIGGGAEPAYFRVLAGEATA